jgi:methionine synthase II (cobalamin-independent)
VSDYDPKQATGIPTEQVGSLPRPQKLQDAYAAYDKGEIDKSGLESAQDEAVKSSIEGQENAGSPIVSDGEQRWSSFATYPIADTLAGTGLADNLAGDGGQFFAIFADGHNRQLPRLTGGPFRYKTYAADTLAKSIGYAHRPMKQAVIAPSMLYLLYPLEGEIDGYPKEQFEKDLADECERDIRKAFDAGAVRVSIDFTEGRLATRNDPRNPWTGAGLLDRFIEINNWVLDRFTPEERANIGVHTCPGGDRDSVHSADVPYNNLLPKMFQMNAGYFLIQLASERDKDPVYESIGKHVRSDANGVAQTVRVDRQARPQRRERCGPDRVRRGDQPAEPADREPRGGAGRPRARRQLHPARAARSDRRLRVLAVLDRREAQPRFTGLRPGRRVPEDPQPDRGRARRGREARRLTPAAGPVGGFPRPGPPSWVLVAVHRSGAPDLGPAHDDRGLLRRSGSTAWRTSRSTTTRCTRRRGGCWATSASRSRRRKRGCCPTWPASCARAPRST